MEEWRYVVGFEGRYEISDKGNVRSLLPRNRVARRPPPRRTIRFVRGIAGQYLGAHLQGEDKKVRVWTIHRMVAEAFIGQRPPGNDVRHLDGNPLNNNVENLSYGTRAENMADAVRHGVMQHGSQRHNAKLMDLDVVHIRQLVWSGLPRKDVATMYGIGRTQVLRIILRDQWKHVA